MDNLPPPGVVITFVLDTSISMNLKMEMGLTYFDAAKATIRCIIKQFPEWYRDRTLQVVLFTYGANPFAFQSRSSLDLNFAGFLDKLNSVRAVDAFSGDRALMAAYEYLHLLRMEYNLDTLGEGRKPWCGMPNYICWLTDGEAIVQKDRVLNKFESLPADTPGLQYFQNDFRWDQRLFIYYFNQKTKRMPSYIEDYAKVRGGHAFHLWSIVELKSRLESQANPKYSRYSPELSFADPGLMINLLDLQRQGERALGVMRLVTGAVYRCRVPYHAFPENYWATSDIARLPVRESLPTIYFERGDKKIAIPPNYPVDKYQLQPCSLTEEILSYEKPQYWPVNVLNSFSEPGKSFPFGYLTANSGRTGVSLVVLGYNFSDLFILLQKPLSTPQRLVDAAWVNEIKVFLQHTPFYHHKSTLESIMRVGVHALDPKDFTYTDTEVMRDIAHSHDMARERFHSRGYHLFPIKTHHNPTLPKDFSNNLVKDAFSVPRHKLLSSLHTQKHYFFECGRVEEASRVKEAIPANKRSLPLDVMQDYSTGMNQRQKLRNPFDTDDDIRYKERTAFGNPYLRRDSGNVNDEPQNIEDQAVPRTPPRIGHHQAERRPRRRSVSPSTFDIARVPRLRDIDALTDTEDDEEELRPNRPRPSINNRPIPQSQQSTPTSSREPSPPPKPTIESTPTPPLATREPPLAPPPREITSQVISNNKSWAKIKSELTLLATRDDKDYNESALIQQITAIDNHPAYTSIKKYNLFVSLSYHAKAKRRKGLLELLDTLAKKRKNPT